MNRKTSTAAFLSCLSVLVISTDLARSAAAAPENQPAQTPAVGDKAPDFTLNDLKGQPITLSELTAKSPVVLVVLRGYPGYQCPICSIQVGSLLGKAKELSAAKAQVVFVYPGPANQLNDRAGEFIKARKLPENFSFLTDPDYKFTESYGLRWNAPRETAYPSTFVIDPQGTVRFAKGSRTHGDRANVSDILNALPMAN